jgi:hypothetical protein
MVFERTYCSCYSGELFAAMMSENRGGIGFAGESARLSTLVDAYRGHRVACFADTSARSTHDDTAACEVHRAVSRVSGLYGDVYETSEWIASTLSRKLGGRKNAGG